MIYKIPGCIDMDKLRVIHLFKADFNLGIVILFGEMAIHHQINNAYLHKGQYRKRGGEYQDITFSKLLHYQLSTYTKILLGHFESDAASCFDRIVM